MRLYTCTAGEHRTEFTVAIFVGPIEENTNLVWEFSIKLLCGHSFKPLQQKIQNAAKNKQKITDLWLVLSISGAIAVNKQFHQSYAQN